MNNDFDRAVDQALTDPRIELAWVLACIADHAAADAALELGNALPNALGNVGPEWRVKFQPDAPDSLYELTTIDEDIGWLHYYDASGKTL